MKGKVGIRIRLADHPRKPGPRNRQTHRPPRPRSSRTNRLPSSRNSPDKDVELPRSAYRVAAPLSDSRTSHTTPALVYSPSNTVEMPESGGVRVMELTSKASRSPALPAMTSLQPRTTDLRRFGRAERRPRKRLRREEHPPPPLVRESSRSCLRPHRCRSARKWQSTQGQETAGSCPAPGSIRAIRRPGDKPYSRKNCTAGRCERTASPQGGHFKPSL